MDQLPDNFLFQSSVSSVKEDYTSAQKGTLHQLQIT